MSMKCFSPFQQLHRGQYFRFSTNVAAKRSNIRQPVITDTQHILSAIKYPGSRMLILPSNNTLIETGLIHQMHENLQLYKHNHIVDVVGFTSASTNFPAPYSLQTGFKEEGKEFLNILNTFQSTPRNQTLIVNYRGEVVDSAFSVFAHCKVSTSLHIFLSLQYY
jgi:hypothetical protein